MANDEYVLGHTSDGSERERLGFIERGQTQSRSGIWQRWNSARLALPGSRSRTWVPGPVAGRARRPTGASGSDRHRSALPY